MKCHSIKLSMGDYQLDTPMYVISMGVMDIVLEVQSLTTLRTIDVISIKRKGSGAKGIEGKIPIDGKLSSNAKDY